MGSSREPRSKVPIVVAALSAVVLAILWLAIIQNIRGHQGKEPVSGSGREGEEQKEPVLSPPPAPATPAPVHPDATLRPPVEPQAPVTAPEAGSRAEPPHLDTAPRPDARAARQSARLVAPPPSRAKHAARLPAHKGLDPECMVELERLCPDTSGGVNRRTCYQEKESNLSGECQSQLQAMAVRIKEGVLSFKTACETDIKRFCANVQPGGGRILQCLEDRYQEVSDSCYQTLRTKPFRK